MRLLPRVRLGLVILACIGLVNALRAGDVEALLVAGAEAEKRFDPLSALEHYRSALALRPDDPFILQKMARQLSDAVFLQEADEGGRERVLEALGYARRATELDPTSAVNRLSLAILHGRLAAYSDVAEKLEMARRIKQYAEEALELDPNYAWACHVLGRWHLEMAGIGAARRTFVAVFFGGLPPASRAEGVRLLERAVALEPGALAHRVELGIAYAQIGRHAEAEAQWKLSLEMPTVEIYDEPAKVRARAARARREDRS